jgi:hypothetical protein
VVSSARLARSLLERAGQTYAQQAGITLRDKPAPLYQLLVLSTLLSTRIKADIAVAAARELLAAGFTTPQRMEAASWQQRVNALARANYKRYDESTSTALGNGAALLLERYRGDLRRLRAEADGDRERMRELLKQFPRIGDSGADIFCREAQAVWPELRPYFDAKALEGARRVGLPDSEKRLARLVQPDEYANLAAALVRVALNAKLADTVSAAA